ncbi:hypothetical protein CN272_16700 [Bacillus anthracis]|nr:hypothetical protein CUC43_24745 [Bacillus thuringiensis LM1212]KXY70836.1 hypothetical protein AT270_00970 [Bacillus cereus]MBG9839338.1 hypothetical protein [Bacillus tropicus]MBJ8353112.1 hypothetical protein [Bacillus mycoides]OTY49515.1 hypothetical protein BK748_27870 [Bacillus thuringiensis serovar graciosensis]PFC87016.1 hypothetical protein CN272_16700 [Bacillus anthracis]PFT26241.1 hypothetical protein COK52_02705 [Bacillus thuringiensis]
MNLSIQDELQPFAEEFQRYVCAFLRIYFYFENVLIWLNERSVFFTLKLMSMGFQHNYTEFIGEYKVLAYFTVRREMN